MTQLQEEIKQYIRTQELNLGMIQAATVLEGDVHRSFKDSLSNVLIKKFPNSIQAREFSNEN